jgi:hypothetical protein
MEDASLTFADAACGTDIGGIYLAKPVAGGRGGTGPSGWSSQM